MITQRLNFDNFLQENNILIIFSQPLKYVVCHYLYSLFFIIVVVVVVLSNLATFFSHSTNMLFDQPS